MIYNIVINNNLLIERVLNMNEKLDMTLFAQRLKEARNSKGLTQKELSDLSGVSTVMISQYERGDISTGKNPALNNVYSLANALEVSIDWLCGLTEKQDIINESTKIDTDLFLRAIIALLDDLGAEQTQVFRGDSNRTIYTIEVEEFSYIYNFINEYLEIQPVIKGDYLPDVYKETVINKVISKYKNMSVDDLLEYDKAFDDELPF